MGLGIKPGSNALNEALLKVIDKRLKSDAELMVDPVPSRELAQIKEQIMSKEDNTPEELNPGQGGPASKVPNAKESFLGTVGTESGAPTLDRFQSNIDASRTTAGRAMHSEEDMNAKAAEVAAGDELVLSAKDAVLSHIEKGVEIGKYEMSDAKSIAFAFANLFDALGSGTGKWFNVQAQQEAAGQRRVAIENQAKQQDFETTLRGLSFAYEHEVAERAKSEGDLQYMRDFNQRVNIALMGHELTVHDREMVSGLNSDMAADQLSLGIIESVANGVMPPDMLNQLNANPGFLDRFNIDPKTLGIMWDSGSGKYKRNEDLAIAQLTTAQADARMRGVAAQVAEKHGMDMASLEKKAAEQGG